MCAKKYSFLIRLTKKTKICGFEPIIPGFGAKCRFKAGQLCFSMSMAE